MMHQGTSKTEIRQTSDKLLNNKRKTDDVPLVTKHDISLLTVILMFPAMEGRKVIKELQLDNKIRVSQVVLTITVLVPSRSTHAIHLQMVIAHRRRDFSFRISVHTDRQAA